MHIICGPSEDECKDFSSGSACACLKLRKILKCQILLIIFCFHTTILQEGPGSGSEDSDTNSGAEFTRRVELSHATQSAWQRFSALLCRVQQTSTSVTNNIRDAADAQPFAADPKRSSSMCVHVRVDVSLCGFCDAGFCVALASREIFCKECNYLRGRLA